MVTKAADGRARRVQSEVVRREQILTATEHLIAEQGYERTTTAQIARRAGIS
jgi:AcrR family transcriptional regulator